MICGASAGEEWKSVDALAEVIVPAHGYTSSSAPYKNLLKMMVGFNPDERRQFLKFVTGSPRLPIGGLKGLSPKFQVVHRSPLSFEAEDTSLPSVMTCQNYLKMPAYSSLEVMKK